MSRCPFLKDERPRSDWLHLVFFVPDFGQGFARDYPTLVEGGQFVQHPQVRFVERDLNGQFIGCLNIQDAGKLSLVAAFCIRIENAIEREFDIVSC